MGDENQTFLNQRRGQSPEQFPLVSGRAHSAASNLKKRKISKSDDVKNEVELVDEDEEEDSEEELRANNLMLRGISGWLRDTDNENVEHVSGLNQCKRCGPAITEFLSSLLTPMRQELSCFESSSMAPQTMLHHIIYAGSGWWSWHELCNYEQTAARRAREREACRDAWKVSYSASNATKEHVVWHEMLFRHLLVWVHWELREHKGERVLIICFLRCVSEPIAALLAAFLSEEDAKRVDVVLLDSARGLTADRVHVIYSSRFVGRYDQFLGFKQTPADCMWHTLEDDWQLLSGWSGNHSASQMNNVGEITKYIGCQKSVTTQPKALLHAPLSNGFSLQLGDLRFCIGGKLQNLLGRRIAHPQSFITGGETRNRHTLGSGLVEPREKTSMTAATESASVTI